jgi:hypothetical protein
MGELKLKSYYKFEMQRGGEMVTQWQCSVTGWTC